MSNDLGYCPLSGFVDECENVNTMDDCELSFEKKEDGKYKQCKIVKYSIGNTTNIKRCEAKSNALFCNEFAVEDACTTVNVPFNVSHTGDPQMFEHACEDDNASYMVLGSFNESACAFPTPARNVINVSCLSSITKTLGGIDYTFDSITAVQGVPNCGDQDNQNDCNTVDESTGLPPRGWETAPSCVINARTTHTYCSGNGTPIYIATSQFADKDSLLETWPVELTGALVDAANEVGGVVDEIIDAAGETPGDAIGGDVDDFINGSGW